MHIVITDVRTTAFAIPESARARKLGLAYGASDGRRLNAFRMVPLGTELAKAPLVASVHGGPFNLVRPNFSNDGQFLANRGYIVFQPNFRGSTGHGLDYLHSANGDFGNGRVQQDIVDGVRYLLAQGIGDPQRVGITGASFGGYATLLGVTFQAELFKVGVAAVPPADFGWVLREYVGTQTEMVPGVPVEVTIGHTARGPKEKAHAARPTALRGGPPFGHPAVRTQREPAGLLRRRQGAADAVEVRVRHAAAFARTAVVARRASVVILREDRRAADRHDHGGNGRRHGADCHLADR